MGRCDHARYCAHYYFQLILVVDRISLSVKTHVVENVKLLWPFLHLSLMHAYALKTHENKSMLAALYSSHANAHNRILPYPCVHSFLLRRTEI